MKMINRPQNVERKKRGESVFRIQSGAVDKKKKNQDHK